MHHTSAAAPPAPFHGLRAGMLAGALVTLASGAHVVGGGLLPALPVLLAIVTLATLGATAVTRVRLNPPAVLAALGAGQLILHEALITLSSAPTGTRPALKGGHGGHRSADHHELLATLPPAGSGMAEASQSFDAAGTGMLLVHGAATVLCALLLSGGEASLWALAAWLRPLAGMPEVVAPEAGPSPAAACLPPSSSFRPWRNLRQNSRRGPPAAVAF